jgi:hypothetical protein
VKLGEDDRALSDIDIRPPSGGEEFLHPMTYLDGALILRRSGSHMSLPAAPYAWPRIDRARPR